MAIAAIESPHAPAPHRAVTGYALFVLLAGMGAGWALRRALLALLRKRHPEEFARLGRPTGKQLESHLPRHREMHLGLWRFLWNGDHRRVDDAQVARLVWGIRAADLVLALGAVALFAAVAANPPPLPPPRP